MRLVLYLFGCKCATDFTIYVVVQRLMIAMIIQLDNKNQILNQQGENIRNKTIHVNTRPTKSQLSCKLLMSSMFVSRGKYWCFSKHNLRSTNFFFNLFDLHPSMYIKQRKVSFMPLMLYKLTIRYYSQKISGFMLRRTSYWWWGWPAVSHLGLAGCVLCPYLLIFFL